MTNRPRCRARGGASTCRSPRCPEQLAQWAEDRKQVGAALLHSSWPGTIITELAHTIEQLRAKYGNPIIGRTRVVFDMGDGWVLKIPLSDEGVNASAAEAYACSRAKEREPFIPIAECAFHRLGERWFLRMERVEPLLRVDHSAVPEWVGYVDCAQVGYTRTGKLVAYDL